MSALPVVQTRSRLPGPPRRPRLARGDHEFLPAALEILETPLSPIRGSIIVTICALAAIALVWSYYGQVDIIATAQGKIQPVGRTKTIQPIATGKVARVAVENGRHVRAGEILLSLDAWAAAPPPPPPRGRLLGTIAAEQALVDTLKERVDMRTTLEASKAESRAKVIDALELMQTQAATLASERGQIGEIDAGLDRIQRDVDKAYVGFAAETAQKLAEVERLMDENAEKLAKARIKTAEMTLRSPIDGTVSGLAVTSLGQVVTVGEQVMQIVPEDATLEIECYLPNGDIGFVRQDQKAVVKIESFPFTDYGTIDATVERVAHDAIPQPDADQREQNPAAAAKDTLFGGAQRTQNLVFPVTLAMERSTIHSDGADVPLVPGMAVTVEIKTGRRRILSYLFSPLLQATATALRER